MFRSTKKWGQATFLIASWKNGDQASPSDTPRQTPRPPAPLPARTFYIRPLGDYLYAMAALDDPSSGIISNRVKPASRHHSVNSAPVKSNASPNSMSIVSDMKRP
jgi:hypothetical protein